VRIPIGSLRMAGWHGRVGGWVLRYSSGSYVTTELPSHDEINFILFGFIRYFIWVAQHCITPAQSITHGSVLSVELVA
jgi:hypothetical protein